MPPEALPHQTPVILVTGPAGSGKTTFINALVSEPGMADSLVVLCELGKMACTHPLQAHASIGLTTRLRRVCACCRVPKNLAATLREANWRFAREGRRQFSRVVIEAGSMPPEFASKTGAPDEDRPDFRDDWLLQRHIVMPGKLSRPV